MRRHQRHDRGYWYPTSRELRRILRRDLVEFAGKHKMGQWKATLGSGFQDSMSKQFAYYKSKGVRIPRSLRKYMAHTSAPVTPPTAPSPTSPSRPPEPYPA